MKNLNKLYNECVSDALSIGLDISDRIVRVSVNSRLSRALGRCRMGCYWDGNRYEIEIQPNILADNVEDCIAKNVIMHELIHTCTDCFNHGWEFQHRAGIVNRKLGYNVRTTESDESLMEAGVVLKQAVDNYCIICNKCGKTLKKYKRWSSTLANIGNYRHGGVCGGSLHVESLNSTVGIASAIWEKK